MDAGIGHMPSLEQAATIWGQGGRSTRGSCQQSCLVPHPPGQASVGLSQMTLDSFKHPLPLSGQSAACLSSRHASGGPQGRPCAVHGGVASRWLAGHGGRRSPVWLHLSGGQHLGGALKTPSPGHPAHWIFPKGWKMGVCVSGVV